jgi:sporulation protein YlmC with PRC-barrel domain
MNIVIGDVVRAHDGEVGTVKRFLFEPRAGRVEHIVVDPGFLQGEDRAVPIDDISGAGEGVVTVDMDEAAFKALGVWNPDAFRAKTMDYEGPPSHDLEGVNRGDFLMDETVATGQAGFTSGKTFGFPGGEQIVPDDQQFADVSKGTDIVDLDGEKVGDVESMAVDPVQRTVTRLAMRRGLIFGGEIEIPPAWFDRALPGRVVLKVGKDEVESLSHAA